MDILKVRISRKNNATTREVLAVELPILEELFQGGESDSDIIVLDQHKATKDEMSRFLQRPMVDGVVESDTDIPDAELCFMNLAARYSTKDGAEALKAIYPSMNAFRRAFNGAEKQQKAA